MSPAPSNVNNPRHLAHDIFNQLAIISGHASLLQMSPNISANEQSALHAIAEAVQTIQQRVRLLALQAEASAKPTE
jgi:signal transduction histidine kinase